MRTRPLIIALIFGAAIAYKVNIQGENMLSTTTPPSAITIRIGEQGQDFATRYSKQLSFDPQPAGLDFYEFNWPSSNPAAVTLDHVKHRVTIEHVLGLSGYQNTEFPSEGLAHFSMSAGLSKDEFIPHDEARIRMFEILNYIHRQGWKTLIMLGTPRLRAKDMLDYLLETEDYTTLDVSYVPTLSEWMQLESRTSWAFYADGIFMWVSFSRSPIYTDPRKPGVYLINFRIHNAQEYFRRAVPQNDRDRWIEAYPDTAARLQLIREDAKNLLRKRGIKIDDTYVDPPVPKLR